MNKTLLIFPFALLLCIIVAGTGIVRAGFEQDFDSASEFESYQGDMAHMTVRLLQNTTRTLHRENMEMLKKLEEIKKEITEIKDLLEE
ncbi:MAG: hypothetical protein U9Q08_00650 [Candidatus Omnitrophota bacterium]|nr:hypothetical protein [Candidatus Omnitrophota bacterium]